jgi:6-phosphogluconolactonase
MCQVLINSSPYPGSTLSIPLVTVDPSGKYAYVANQGSNNVSQYTIGANGSLTAMSNATVAAGASPVSVAVDPSGTYAYVANCASGNNVSYTQSARTAA